MTNDNNIPPLDEQTGDVFTIKKDELWYDGEGDLLDTAEGRAKFCRLNETSIFRKDDPDMWNSKIWVYNIQNQGLTVKKRSRADTTLFECIEYDADGKEINKFFDPYE